MKGTAIGPVVLAGLAPALFLLLILGLFMSGAGGWVLWRPPVLWTDQFGATKTYVESVVVGVAAESNSLDATGYLNHTFGGLSFDPSDVGTPFVRKYSPDGHILWTVYPQNIPRFSPSGVAVGSDGMYIVGTSAQNATLLKYSFTGTQLWNESIGPPVRGAISVSNNSLYFADWSGFFVQRYDSRGNKLWSNKLPYSPGVIGEDLHADSLGVYVLTTGSITRYDSAGNEIWSLPSGTNLNGPEAISEDNTGVYASGSVRSSSGAFKGFLSKYNSNGSVVWTSLFDSPDGSGVAATTLWADSSGVYVSFESIAGSGFVAKYDSNQGQAWNFHTPVAPTGVFAVAAVAGEFFLAGSIARQYAFVQAFSGSASLIFFGVNPPLSFLVLGTVVAVISVGVFFLERRYSRRASRRPKSANIDRYRDPYRSPNLRA